MKRLVTIMLIVLLLACSLCFAEELSLDSMNLQQLIELQQTVQKKIFEKDPGCDGVLYQGKYIVGKDIESGGYLFQCIMLAPEKVRISISTYSENGDTVDFEYVDLGENYYLRIDDGYTLRIDGGIVSCLKRQ